MVGDSQNSIIDAQATCVLDGHAKNLLLVGEQLRLEIAEGRSKTCTTLHQAAQAVHAECEGSKSMKALVKDLNLLNDAYVGVRHFDAQKLKELSARVDEWRVGGWKALEAHEAQ